MIVDRVRAAARYLPVEAIEHAVERHYATVRMSDATAELMRAGFRVELDHQHRRADPEIAGARQRVDELEAERRRLARGVITGAIPEYIGREEHDRITAEAKQAEAVFDTQTIYANVEQPLKAALNLAGRADEIYRIGGPRPGNYPTSSSSPSCSSPKSMDDRKSSKPN